MRDLQELLGQLVAFPTMSQDQPVNRQALDFIEQYLQVRGMHTKRLKSNDYESLIATSRPTKTPITFLAAHVDVVPASEHMFTMHAKGGKLFGRGVFDMKFSIAAYMKLVDTLQNRLHEYDFGLMITTEEEIDGKNGTGFLIEEGYIPQFVLLPDGGDNWQLEETCRGYYGSRITVNGKSAHGSRPWEGESATMRLHDVLGEIRQLFPKNMTPAGDTLNISGLSGGQAINQIPERAEAMLDMRTNDPERYAWIHEQVAAICKKHKATYEVLTTSNVCVADLENPYVKIFRDIIAKHTGVTTTSHSFGVTDVRFLAPKGITTISVQPYGGGRHGDDEWIDAHGVTQFYEVVQEFITTVAHVDSVSKTIDTA